jgi:hypothetical protein
MSVKLCCSGWSCFAAGAGGADSRAERGKDRSRGCAGAEAAAREVQVSMQASGVCSSCSKQSPIVSLGYITRAAAPLPRGIFTVNCTTSAGAEDAGTSVESAVVLGGGAAATLADAEAACSGQAGVRAGMMRCRRRGRRSERGASPVTSGRGGDLGEVAEGA